MLFAVTDLKALVDNANRIKEIAGCGIIAVLKHDAYSAGLIQCARALDGAVTAFAVSSPHEALKLLSADVTANIMVVSPVQPHDLGWVPEKIIVPIDCPDILEHMQNIHIKKQLRVQLRIDACGSGIGLDEQGFEQAFDVVQKNKRFKLYGVFSHCPSIYRGEDATIAADKFAAIARKVKSVYPGALCHIATSASLGHRTLAFDAVRVGTALYGLPSFDSHDVSYLEPVITLYSILSRVIDQKGDTLSFYENCVDTGLVKKIGIVSAGYGDLPALINKKGVLVAVRGRLVPVIGNCSMSHMIIDLTGVPEAQAGDRAVLVGRSADRTISAAVFAKNCSIPVCRCEGALFTTPCATKLIVQEPIT